MHINNDGRIIMNNLPVHEFLQYITPPYNNDHGVEIRANLFDNDRDPATEDYISVTAVWYTRAPAMLTSAAGLADITPVQLQQDCFSDTSICNIP